MAKHHWLSMTSGEERKCILPLTIATTLLTPGDEENASEVEPSYEIRTQADLLVTLGYFEKNQRMQKQMPAWSLAIWSFPFLFYTFP